MLTIRIIIIVTAIAGGIAAMTAFIGKMTRKLQDRTVDRLYYLGYALMFIGMVLFIIQGLLR